MGAQSGDDRANVKKRATTRVAPTVGARRGIVLGPSGQALPPGLEWQATDIRLTSPPTGCPCEERASSSLPGSWLQPCCWGCGSTRPEPSRPRRTTGSICAWLRSTPAKPWRTTRTWWTTSTGRNPDVLVELQGIPGSYYDKLLVMFAGRTAPDVMWMGKGMAQFASRGASSGRGGRVPDPPGPLLRVGPGLLPFQRPPDGVSPGGRFCRHCLQPGPVRAGRPAATRSGLDPGGFPAGGQAADGSRGRPGPPVGLLR